MPDIPPRRRRSGVPKMTATPEGVVIEESPPVKSPPEDSPPEPPYIPRATPKDKKTDPESPGRPHQTIERKLTNFFVGMALPFAAAGDKHCAAILAERGPIVAEAWANLANESPAVKKYLEGMLKGGAWAGAISTTLTVVVPIAAHHGMPIPDVVSPVIFGMAPKKDKDESSESEPFTAQRVPPDYAPPIPTNYGSPNGGGAPGPAAVSILRQDSGAANPSNYPQTGNASQFRKN